MMKRLILLCVVLASCGTNPTAPTARVGGTGGSPPPGVPAGPPTAVIVVDRFALVRDGFGNLVPQLHLVETGGESAAYLGEFEFNTAEGQPWTNPPRWAGSWRVEASGEAYIEPRTAYFGEYEWSFEVAYGFTGPISVLASYVDNQGRRGSARAVAFVSR